MNPKGALWLLITLTLLQVVFPESEAATIEAQATQAPTQEQTLSHVKQEDSQGTSEPIQETRSEAESLFQLGEDYLYGDGDAQERDLTKAFQYYKGAADLGHSGAQFVIGLAHFEGLGMPKDDARGVLYMTFSAKSGNTNAQLSLANRHMYGYGVSQSCDEAAMYYRKVADKVAKSYQEAGVIAHVDKVKLNDNAALQQRQTEEDVMQYYQYSADKGDVQSQMILGRAYMFGSRGVTQNAELAEDYFNKAIEAGESAGHGGLGQLYAQGVQGGPKPLARNFTKAAYHFKVGANLGNPVSQNGMGFLYMSGHGVKVNYTEAARYFRMASDLSNAEAQYNLGVLYLNGEGVPKDSAKALKYLQLASQQGQILAHWQLANMYMDGIGPVQQPNCMMAVKFYRAVCDKGDWNSLIEDAHDMYLHGDYTAALMMYSIVAEQGYELGQNNVAYLLDQGHGFEDISRDLIYPMKPDPMELPNKDIEDTDLPHVEKELTTIMKERALLWYEKSSDQGNVDSVIKVGDFHYYGYGTRKDLSKSVDRYRQAGDRGHSQALFNLGYMHENGLSIPKDLHLAKRYYDQAATHSPNAWVPVQMALMKLRVRKWMSESKAWEVPTVFGYKWDDILLTFLVGMLIILIVFRQTARRAQG